jgi:16S rRNA (guanine527-N7)-methyltransferase
VEHGGDLLVLLKTSAESFGIVLDPSHLEIFMEYLDQLLRWNQVINLTSITNKEEIIVKHFVDSLAGLQAEAFTQAASVLDIGTGAGFPGIPLRIVRPDLQLTLVEPVMKKISFLRFLIGLLKLHEVRVYEGTIEQFVTESNTRQSFDYIVTRALKHDAILKSSSLLLKNGGKVIFYLSEPISREALQKGMSIFREYSFELPKNLGKRVISVVSLSHQ